MKHLFFGLIASTSVLVAPSAIVNASMHEQGPPQEICRDVYIEASEEIRTVELPQFGISLDIPANYRAVAFDKDRVQIMTPSEWALYSCKKRGGELLYNHGGFGFEINKTDHPTPQAALEERKQGPYNTSGTVYKYYLDDQTEVLIDVISSGVSTIKAFFSPPSKDEVIVLTLTCDCEIDVDAMVMELDRIRVLY